MSSTPTDPKLASIEAFFTAYRDGDRDGISAVLAENISWTIPGHHPLAGTKHGIDEVLAFFDALASVGFQAETFFLQASDDYVVDIHRGYSTAGDGQVDTSWALVWHFDTAGRVDNVMNLSADQHQMDSFIWDNFPLAPIPGRLADAGRGSGREST